jgi:hypothetical protein
LALAFVCGAIVTHVFTRCGGRCLLCREWRNSCDEQQRPQPRDGGAYAVVDVNSPLVVDPAANSINNDGSADDTDDG